MDAGVPMETDRKCVPGPGRLLGGLAAASGEALPDVEVPCRAWPLAVPPLAAPPPRGPALACPAVDQVGRAPGAALFSGSLGPAAAGPRVPLAVAALALAPLALAASRLEAGLPAGAVPLSSGEPAAAPALVRGAEGRGLAVLAPRGAGPSPDLPSVARPSDFMAAGGGRRAGVRVTTGASDDAEGGHLCTLGCRGEKRRQVTHSNHQHQHHTPRRPKGSCGQSLGSQEDRRRLQSLI